MDIFIEKIVVRKKTGKDYMIMAGLILGGFILAFIIIPMIPFINRLWLFFAAGIAYGVYYLITARNIEYEYALTNGDLDVDMIIAQRKRKRLLSVNCKDFEVVAPVGSVHYTHEVRKIPQRFEFVSSMDAQNLYFIVTNYNGVRSIIFFEPDSRMLQAFKTYIPRRVFE